MSDGFLVNSDKASGLSINEGRDFVLDLLGQEKAKLATVYRLRDWLISRQRYWGVPIPVIFDQQQAYGVSKSSLPLLLPDIDDVSLLR